MVQPLVTFPELNVPNPPDDAFIAPVTSASVAYIFPAKVTLNGLVLSVGPVPPDQKTLSVEYVGLLIPAVLFAIVSLEIDIYPLAEFNEIFPWPVPVFDISFELTVHPPISAEVVVSNPVDPLITVIPWVDP